MKYGQLKTLRRLVKAMVCGGLLLLLTGPATHTTFASTAKVAPPQIQITKPNGGEKYWRGIPKKMKWTSTLSSSDKVRIEVWRYGSFVHRVDKSTRNDGVYKLTFPDEAEPGGGYKMRVILNSNPIIYDESDAPFKVK